MQSENIFIKLKEKIQFCRFIINLFHVFGAPLQMASGSELCIWI